MFSAELAPQMSVQRPQIVTDIYCSVQDNEGNILLEANIVSMLA